MTNRVRACPNCGSTDISSDRSDMLSRMGLNSNYRCDDCGYSGIFPEIESDKVREHRQEVKKRGKVARKIDEANTPGTGRILIGVLFFLAGILPAIYAPWGAGRLAGIMSLLIGAAIMWEYASSLQGRQK